MRTRYRTAERWGTLEEEAYGGVPFGRSTILAAAFGLLLVLIGVSAVATWTQTLEIHDNIASLHRSHKEAANALTRIKSGVYVAGILLRDSLLDPDPANNAEYVTQFEAIRSEAERDVKQLEAFLTDPQQRNALALLLSELRIYWQPAEVALDLEPEERVARRMQLLRQRVRKRQEIFQITNRVEDLLAANFNREQTRMDRAQADLKRSLMWSTGIALGLGLLTAAFTLARLMRLERESDEAASELRRLSNNLRTAQEEERKNLSRELHDQVGQMLTALRMELAAVSSEGVDPRGLDRARGTLDQTMKTVRNMAMLLRPSMLDDLGLGPAVSWQVKEFSRLTGIAADASIDEGLDALPEKHRTCLYRVIQEALTNCARHSKASKVFVALRKENGSVRASIADDGGGFAQSDWRAGGLGLLGMEERVRELEGEFSVKSQVGQGTRIEVRLPTTAKHEHSNSDRRRPWHRARRAEAPAGTPSGH